MDEFRHSVARRKKSLVDWATTTETELASVKRKLFEATKAFEEERKANVEALKKMEALKDRNKEIADENYQLDSTLQNDLKTETEKIEQLKAYIKNLKSANNEFSQCEVELLAENAKNLETYQRAIFQCFYMFWKNNWDDNFSYLLEEMQEDEFFWCL